MGDVPIERRYEALTAALNPDSACEWTACQQQIHPAGLGGGRRPAPLEITSEDVDVGGQVRPNASVPNADEVVQPGIRGVLGFEECEERLVPHPGLIEVRAASEVEHHFRPVGGGHDPPNTWQHGSITSPVRMVRPLVTARQPLPGHSPVTATPAGPGLVAIRSHQMKVALVSQVNRAQ